MAQKGKRFRASLEGFDCDQVLPLREAIDKVKSFKPTKFEQSVDLCMHLGIDAKQADQLVRGSLSLPHGIGKTRRVVAFCGPEHVAAAKEAGAVEAGSDDLIKKIQDGWMEFDVAVATPDVMKKVSRLGRQLGPRGLMPSPKAGTVTPQVAEAVKEYGAGKLEFRNDSGGNVHAVIGRVGFETDKLAENAKAFIDTIERMKPSSSKGIYVKKISVAATMSPGVLVAV
jgi:large subunit ribosomal protein L1